MNFSYSVFRNIINRDNNIWSLYSTLHSKTVSLSDFVLNIEFLSFGYIGT